MRRPVRHAARGSFRRKVRYLLDSVFAFTDLPISLLLAVGGFGILCATVLGVVTFAARVFGGIAVPGYAALTLIVTFFGALNLFGLGLVGQYAWRGFENTKRRPSAISRSRKDSPPCPHQSSNPGRTTPPLFPRAPSRSRGRGDGSRLRA